MYQILSTTPMTPVDGHVDVDLHRSAAAGPRTWGRRSCRSWSATITAARSSCSATSSRPRSRCRCRSPTAHASDNWRISVRGTTNMGRDTYEQGQFRFHDGGVPYASDNFAWGPDGGYGIIMFADRRGFAIRPVKAEIAEQVDAGAGGRRRRAWASTCRIRARVPPPSPRRMGPTTRAHLDGGFDTSDQWDEIAPGVRMAAGIAGEPTCGPVLVFLDCAAGREAVPAHSIGTETIVAPVSGSVDAAGVTLTPGRRARGGSRRRASRPRRRSRRRAARAHLRRPAGAALGARRRERSSGALGAALSPVLEDLQRQLPLADSAS